MEQPLSTLGELLRDHRQRAGVTQQELAQRAGIGVRTLRDLERNRVRHPRPWSLRRLAVALRVSGADRGRLLATARPAAATRGGLGVEALGPLVVRRDRVVVEVSQPILRRLLGLLAVQPGQVVPRDEIVDVLWGERPPPSCLEPVHNYVARLRGLLEPARKPRTPAQVVVRVGGGYRLAADAGQLDVLRFGELIAQARRARAAADLGAAVALWGRALALWRGPVLAGLDGGLRRHPSVVALSQQRVAAGLAYADGAIALGRGEEVVAALRALTREEPLHEGLHARLMLALAGSGQQAAALELLPSCGDGSPTLCVNFR